MKVQHYEMFLPDEMAVGQLEGALKVAMRDLTKIDGKSVEPFLKGLLSAVQQFERSAR